MKGFTSLLILLLLIPAGAGTFIWSGIYDVSANIPRYGISDWLIATLKKNSIAFHARGIAPPAGLTDPESIRNGIVDFSNSCSRCHGAPGETRQAFSTGLHPTPPILVSGRVQKERTEAQLYLIVKNGLKFSGMPAFGNIHEDLNIWNIIAVLKILPKLSSGDYQSILEEDGTDEGDTLRDEEFPGIPDAIDSRMKPNTI